MRLSLQHKVHRHRCCWHCSAAWFGKQDSALSLQPQTAIETPKIFVSGFWSSVWLGCSLLSDPVYCSTTTPNQPTTSQLPRRNSRFSECMACVLRYSNESVCSENCFVCVTDIAPRLCLAWAKWILLYNFYACSNVYILFFLHFIIVYGTYVRCSY